MSVGLDLGTHRLRSLRLDGRRLSARRCRSIFSVLPDATSRRHRLDQLGLPYAACAEEILVYGDAAEELAQLVPIRTIPLLPEGAVPRRGAPARQILSAMIEALLGNPVEPNEVCCLTHPGNTGRSQNAFQDGVASLRQLVRSQGYTPLIISPGLALILAELVSDSFTGLGMTWGASTCEVSLAHHGREIARCTVPYGGNRIDDKTARETGHFAWDARGRRYLATADLREWKESFSGSLISPAGADSEKSPETARLAEAYRTLIHDVLHDAAQELSTVPAVRTVPQPMPLVISGGTARMAGFREMLMQTLRAMRFPIQLGEVRLVVESEYTIARGCLINAELDVQTRSPERFAA